MLPLRLLLALGKRWLTTPVVLNPAELCSPVCTKALVLSISADE